MKTSVANPHPVWQQSIRAVISIMPLAFIPLHAAPSSGGIVSLGAGSYTTARPATCKPLPEKIFKTAAFKGAMPTNQWWSSLVFQKYSQNMFPHPLGVVCVPAGLAVSYPGADVRGAKRSIMGGGVSKTGDFIIGLTTANEFPEANCAGNSDWFVDAEFAQGTATLRTSFGHGSPYVFCTYSGGKPGIQFPAKPIIWAGNAKSATLGITAGGHHYGLFGASASQWSGLDGTTFTNETDKSYFSIALLPDKQPETLARFQKCAHNHVVDTRVVSKTEAGKLRAAYKFTVKPMEGGGTDTIYALYPHQWKYTDAKLTGQSYGSVRGEMKIGEGSGFLTSVPIQGLLPMFPKEGIADRERMTGYLNAEAGKKPAPFADTYWEGKHLGKLATLGGIAEMAGATDLQKQFIGEIKRRLENWFTVSPGEDSPLFHYDSNWGTLIGSKPSYGSDKSLNDHHFHYGYFIRAAGEVARLDPAWAEKWAPMVKLIMRDIASPDRDDPMFPYIRCFDKYAGHSWASGDANFGDGNNQESSSESMNAWYGMMLWGAATGDEEIAGTGLFLFNTERTAVEEYWFDVSDTNFPKEFPEVALGMIWGGKGDFATWFSGDIDCIHGINWLPFTPSSIYMGRSPGYVKKNFDSIVAKRKGGNDFNTGWGDLVIMFDALNDPKAAVEYLNANPDCKLEGGNTHAFMYHWIHTLDRLGINDASVTADYPFFNVFNKTGKKTYAVYNYGKTPRTVVFSDGIKVLAAPGTLTVKH